MKTSNRAKWVNEQRKAAEAKLSAQRKTKKAKKAAQRKADALAKGPKSAARQEGKRRKP